MGVLPTYGAVVLVIAALGTGPRTTTAGGASPFSADEPSLELRPELTDFDSVVVGDEDDRTVRIHNLGTTTVKLGEVEVDGEGFSILFDNCSGMDVESNESCAVTILFQPPDTGTFDGSVSLSDPVELRGDLVGMGVETSGSTTVPPETSTTVPPETSTTVPSATTTSTPAESTVPPAATSTSTPAATSPPTTLPDGGDTLAEQLAQCEAEAAHAQVTFTPALEMVVGEIADVSVTAHIGEDQGPTPTGTGPPVTQVPAILHCEVRATLRGQDFEIDPTEPQDGSFFDQPSITWTWQVTPQSAGLRTLLFRILPVVQSDGFELPGTPVPFEATITVDAAPRSFWQRVDDLLRSIAGHPFVTGFGALAGIVLVLAAGWRWILKRRWPWAPQPGRKASNTRAPPPRRRSRGS